MSGQTVPAAAEGRPTNAANAFPCRLSLNVITDPTWAFIEYAHPPEDCAMLHRLTANIDVLGAVSCSGLTWHFEPCESLPRPFFVEDRASSLLVMYYRPSHALADFGETFAAIRRHFGLPPPSSASALIAAAIPPLLFPPAVP
jgi:hypothetical protein